MKSTAHFDEITVYGARGHSMMILRGLEEGWRGRVRIRALIDDLEHGFIHPKLGIPVISSQMRLDQHADLPVLMTVSKPALRRRLVEQLDSVGATLATAVFPDQPHVDPDVRYGSGAVVMPWTRIGPSVSIGSCCLILSMTIAHDVEVGDYTTMALESSVAGHIRIGQDVNIAPQGKIANGSPRRWLTIGEGAEVGTGALVIADVPPRARMIGNPAMPLRDWIRLRRLLKGPDDPESP